MSSSINGSETYIFDSAHITEDEHITLSFIKSLSFHIIPNRILSSLLSLLHSSYGTNLKSSYIFKVISKIEIGSLEMVDGEKQQEVHIEWRFQIDVF